MIQTEWHDSPVFLTRERFVDGGRYMLIARSDGSWRVMRNGGGIFLEVASGVATDPDITTAMKAADEEFEAFKGSVWPW